jgi:hypothetical protein
MNNHNSTLPSVAPSRYQGSAMEDPDATESESESELGPLIPAAVHPTTSQHASIASTSPNSSRRQPLHTFATSQHNHPDPICFPVKYTITPTSDSSSSASFSASFDESELKRRLARSGLSGEEQLQALGLARRKERNIGKELEQFIENEVRSENTAMSEWQIQKARQASLNTYISNHNARAASRVRSSLRLRTDNTQGRSGEPSAKTRPVHWVYVEECTYVPRDVTSRNNTLGKTIQQTVKSNTCKLRKARSEDGCFPTESERLRWEWSKAMTAGNA